MPSFENQAPSLAATAAEIASLRGASDEARLLRDAKATLVQTGHDNWDGGIDIYALMLEIPIPVYANLEETRSKIEKSKNGSLIECSNLFADIAASQSARSLCHRYSSIELNCPWRQMGPNKFVVRTRCLNQHLPTGNQATSAFS